jgi:hypothetical protein
MSKIQEKINVAGASVVLALASFTGGCSRDEALASQEGHSDRSIPTSNIRAQLDSLNSDQKRAFVQEKISNALDYIALIPELSVFVDSVLNSDKPRASFELVSDIDALSRDLGVVGFSGDALTMTAKRTNSQTNQGTFRHVINLSPECFSTDGKLTVILIHELTHMQRRENGVPLESPTAEEQETFSAGIKLALSVNEKLSSGNRVRDENYDSQMQKEIEDTLINERIILSQWLRRPR